MKSQLSMEFILLFSLLFFMFVSIGSILPRWLENTNDQKDSAEYIMNDIKMHIITASLSVADFQAQLVLPSTLNGQLIKIEIYPLPDNQVSIFDEDGLIITSCYLPEIEINDSSDAIPGNDRLEVAGTLDINKEGGIITLSV